MELQVTTIGAFMASVDQDRYFLLEKHQTAEGYSTRLVALRECDIREVAGQLVTVLWDERAAYAVLTLLNRADPPSVVVVAAGLAQAAVSTPRFIFPGSVGRPTPTYLYPVRDADRIAIYAHMLAVGNESWKQDGCMDTAVLVREGSDYAQLDFDRRQPPLVYWTDDEPAYMRLFAAAYAACYSMRVLERRVRETEHGQSEGK